MTQPQNRSAAVIGGGPAGLMAAETLANAGLRVIVYDRMPSLARKLLMAGRGGLNITHGEEFDRFVSRYRQASGTLRPMLEAFPPQALRDWCADLGEPTFVGSSGRIFPKSFKASPLLRAWLRRLAGQGVEVRLRHKFEGWTPDGALRFSTPDGDVTAAPDVTILALGGASWPRLGSDGGWVEALRARGIGIAHLRPANCGFEVDWTTVFRDRFAGEPLKSIAVEFASESVRGEALVTRHGLEGGAIYALSAPIRDAIGRDGSAALSIDLRPDVAEHSLETRLTAPRGGQSASNWLRKAAGLSPVAIGLLREAGPLPPDAAGLAARIKHLPIRLTGVRPIERAISTAGGVRFEDLDENLMLRAMPGVFCCGEMLDWEAPTGGYLLQACFATAVRAGMGARVWVEGRNPVI